MKFRKTGFFSDVFGIETEGTDFQAIGDGHVLRDRAKDREDDPIFAAYEDDFVAYFSTSSALSDHEISIYYEVARAFFATHELDASTGDFASDLTTFGSRKMRKSFENAWRGVVKDRSEYVATCRAIDDLCRAFDSKKDAFNSLPEDGYELSAPALLAVIIDLWDRLVPLADYAASEFGTKVWEDGQFERLSAEIDRHRPMLKVSEDVAADARRRRLTERDQRRQAIDDEPRAVSPLCSRCEKRPRHFDDLCKRCANEIGVRPRGPVR